MNPPDELWNALRERRRACNLSQAELAARVGLSRQALVAIESGAAVPSTAAALRLARALGTTVEALFALAPEPLCPRLAPGPGSARLVLGRVGGLWVGHRLLPGSPEPADALLDPQGQVQPLEAQEVLERKVLIAGCAPPLGPLSGHINHSADARASWLHATSGAALGWLAQGLVHVAGLHLAERAQPGTHDALVQAALPGVAVHIVTFAAWREGLIVAPGNPLGIDGVGDLVRKGVRVAQRPANAGAPQVLARALEREGLGGFQPSGPLVGSHPEAAQAVLLGAVDAAVVIEPVAEALGLPFIPLVEERFELVLRAEHLDHPGVGRLLDRLGAASFARELSGMGNYDTTELGRVCALGAA